MSRVFVAFDDTLQRRVAVKVLPEHMAAAVSVDRFRREILLSAGLQHPHIVGVLSAGIADGVPYFVMPYVEGESLGTRLLTRGRLSVPHTVSVMKDVARALAYAHERGVVHRDIKPHNILLTSGAATVTDFGVAKALSSAQRSGDGKSTTLTDAGMSLGTPLYMAPEQAAADPDVDHRADIYALGVDGVRDAHRRAAVRRARSARADHRAHDRGSAARLHRARRRSPGARRPGDAVPRSATRPTGRRRPSSCSPRSTIPAMVSGAFAAPGRDLGRWNRLRDWRVVAALLLIVAALGSAAAMLLGRSRAGAPVAATTAAPVAATGARVVVLPLVSIGGDSSNAYLADGITNELASALSRVPGVRVVSPSRAAALLASGRSPTDVGRELDVTQQLEGTVQREGKRLRVTARLVSVQDGTMTWSDVYERDVTDLLSVQDELARVITGAVREAIGAGAPASTPDSTPAAAPRLASNAAYDLYLRGRFQLGKRGAAPLREAINYFERAIASDSGLAPAYSGLAAAQGLLPLYTNASAERSLADALRNADRAITLDANLAEAWATRGVLHGRSWRWAEAERDFRRAIALDPDFAPAQQGLGELMVVRGRIPEAVRALERASQLDANVARRRGLARARAGPRGSRQRGACRRGARGVVRFHAARAATDARHHAAVHAPTRGGDRSTRGRGAHRPSSATALGMLGYAYAVNGRLDEANRVRSRVEALPTATGTEVAVGRIAMGLGDTAQAVTRLERAARAKDPFFATESARSPIFER